MPPVNRNNPTRAASSDSTYSLMEFLRDFPDDEACIEWLWRTRYAEDGEHAHCPKCDEVRTFKRYAYKSRKTTWTCTHCGQHVQPLVGTIFEGSSTSLHLWFYAIYLMSSTRCAISAKQLERELGVTYKTAWRMFNKIRNGLMNDEGEPPLSGHVEIDEATVDGKPRVHMNMREAAQWRERSRATVLGMVERGGRVRLRVIPSWTQAGRERQRCVNLAHLHRRVEALPAARWRVRLPFDRHALGSHLRDGRCAHQHHRRVLRQPQDFAARHVQARVAQVVAVLLGRVRLALQPPPRPEVAVRNATAACRGSLTPLSWIAHSASGSADCASTHSGSVPACA